MFCMNVNSIFTTDNTSVFLVLVKCYIFDCLSYLAYMICMTIGVATGLYTLGLPVFDILLHQAW